MAAPEDPIKRSSGFEEWRKTEPTWNPRLGDNWRFKERIANTDTAVIAHYVYDEEEAKKDKKIWNAQKEVRIKKAQEEKEKKKNKKAKEAKEKEEKEKKKAKEAEGEEQEKKKKEEKEEEEKEEYYGAPHTDNVVLKIKYQRPNQRPNRPYGYPDNYEGDRHEWQFLYSLSGYYPGEDYRDESKAPSRPQNIVRHFRSQWMQPPGSAGQYEIAFLEYCPGVKWNGNNYHNLDVFDRDSSGFIHELDIWLIFRQFTRMIFMLDHGKEIPTENSRSAGRPSNWEDTEICHYNIEPRNILIGYKNKETDRVPVLKLCDFGDALDVPRFIDQEEAGRYRFPNVPNGRIGYRAPEAIIGGTEHVNPFRHGTCSNIFQFANIIRLLMHGDQSSDLDMHPEDGEWVVENIGNYSNDSPATYGRSLIHGVDKIPPGTYSDYLIDLVMECMYEKPSLRPRAKNLWYMVRDGYKECHKQFEPPGPNEPEESDESVEDDSEAEKPKKPRKKKEQPSYPPLHPIFQQAQLAPEGFREPMPEWLDKFDEEFDNWTYPRTPQCPTPEYKSSKGYIDTTPYPGDDLPYEDREEYPSSRAQVPKRHPHGFPIINERPSVNIPEQYGDHPGSITRNLDLLRYYDRLGHMWMGEENYWKMLEAGLDPQTYSWGMRIPDPEMDVDVGPMSGTEADGEEDGGGDEGEDGDEGSKVKIGFIKKTGCPGGV
ncbi:hypothetical protein OCU04_002662 [Sclerotinia nivalis]|uniref:Protein kinase domain-containing protein n=1 Tax=Sclerotinia nivalis TaxID=352851 RepID=A0A9X0AU34_9HELO|nr:hypothetical protein OCU04_002662 [Sclerotinia nivalis]